MAGKVEGQLVGLGKIAIGIEALRQRTGNERAAVHLKGARIRIIAQQNHSPWDVATQMNSFLVKDNEQSMFVTMFIGM